MGRTVAEPRPTGLDGWNGGGGGNGGDGGGGLATRHTEPLRRGGAGSGRRYQERSGRRKILRLYSGGGWCGMLNEC